MARVAKGQPFSVRFSAATDRAVADEARRSRRSKSSVVEALAEEAMRTRLFPGLGFRGDDARRRPWVIGTGLDAWELCQLLAEAESIESLAAEMELAERHLQLALAYRERYADEIADAIAENARPAAEWHELYPFVRTPTPA